MRRRQFITQTLGFSLGLAAAACGDRNSPFQGDRPEVLRFAVTDLQGLEPLEENFGAFCDALSEIIAIPIELVPVQSFLAAPPALIDRQIDLALAGPSEYLLLNARAQAVPIIALTRPDYYSLITVRADSNINSAQDLKGKVVGMRTEGSTAGHIGASQLLADAGLNPVEDVLIRMVGDRGLEALLAGEIDAWGDSHRRTTKFLGKSEGAAEKVKTLITGGPLPNDVLVAAPHLSAEFTTGLATIIVERQETLMEALLKGEENAKYANSKLVAAEDSNYDQVRQMYRTLGLEKLIR